MEGKVRSTVDDILDDLADINPPKVLDEPEAESVYREVNSQMERDAAEYRERESKSELRASTTTVNL